MSDDAELQEMLNIGRQDAPSGQSNYESDSTLVPESQATPAQPASSEEYVNYKISNQKIIQYNLYSSNIFYTNL